MKEAVPSASEGDEINHSKGLEEYLRLCESATLVISIQELVNRAEPVKKDHDYICCICKGIAYDPVKCNKCENCICKSEF